MMDDRPLERQREAVFSDRNYVIGRITLDVDDQSPPLPLIAVGPSLPVATHQSSRRSERTCGSLSDPGHLHESHD